MNSDWWTVTGQTGWRRPGPAYLCQDPNVLRSVRVYTYDGTAPGFADYCLTRLGVSPLAGVLTPLVRAGFQDAWDLWTPLRHCVEIWTPSYPQARQWLHGYPVGDGTFLAFKSGVPSRTDLRTGVKLGPDVRPDDPRLAGYPTVNVLA